MTESKTLWRTLGSDWFDTEPDVDTIAVTMEGPGGKVYAVCCTGYKGMKSNDFITAIRAAAAGLIQAVGGDMSAVGAATLDEAKFDTGNQRPS